MQFCTVVIKRCVILIYGEAPKDDDTTSDLDCTHVKIAEQKWYPFFEIWKRQEDWNVYKLKT